MIFRPYPLSAKTLEKEVLTEDKKHCQKIGPCGIGEKALYLNSFFIDRRYYIPFTAVTRVFKRIAMSEGGFSGKGAFASMSYLVVEYDGGKQKQCNFKYEDQVDEFLHAIHAKYPSIRLCSQSAEVKLAEAEKKKKQELACRPKLHTKQQQEVETLQKAIDYLKLHPEYSDNLSQSAKRKRNYACTSPSYRWVALIITVLGGIACVYGIYAWAHHSNFGIYFALFGMAAIFTFAGLSVLPTARNNRKAVMEYADRSVEKMEMFLQEYPDFPLPARYAHPVVLKRMQRVIQQGKAATIEEALEVVKKDLKSLNADVQVSQEEYDEVVAIKAMFLNANYV